MYGGQFAGVLTKGADYAITDTDGCSVLEISYSARCTGTCTTNTADKIIDSSATFETDGVAVGDVVKNTTDICWGTVSTVDSETQLTMDWDMCPDGNEDYTVYPSLTFTLPTASDNSERIIRFLQTCDGDGDITIDGEGAETINGRATIIFHGKHASITLLCNGTDWSIMDSMGEDIGVANAIRTGSGNWRFTKDNELDYAASIAGSATVIFSELPRSTEIIEVQLNVQKSNGIFTRLGFKCQSGDTNYDYVPYYYNSHASTGLNLYGNYTLYTWKNTIRVSIETDTCDVFRIHAFRTKLYE